nr:hypothetical protein [Pseudomonadota bacterium]
MKLDSDELGRLGQDIFSSRCTTEKLIPNPPAHDRTGWDFRVEFPNSDLNPLAPFDARQVPLPIMAQVKSVRDTSNRVVLKLRTFERLVKLHEPAFVIIPTFNAENELIAFYGIHLVGDALGKALERLTALHIEKSEIAERDTISYSRKTWWKQIDLTPSDGLRTYFQKQISDYAKNGRYQDNKRRDLEEIGYDPIVRQFGNMSISAEKMDDFLDALLGLKEFNVSDFLIKEKRFELERVVHHVKDTQGIGKITPQRHKGFLLRFIRTDTGKASDIECDLTLPAISMTDEKLIRFLVHIDEVTLKISTSGNMQIDIAPLEQIKHSAKRWEEIFTVISTITSGYSELEIFNDKYKRLFRFGELKMNIKADEDSVFNFADKLREKAFSVRYLIEKAGLLKHEISLDTILDENRVVSDVRWLLESGSDGFSYILTLEDEVDTLELPGNSRINIINWLSFDDRVLVYAMNAEVEPELSPGKIKLSCKGTTDHQVVAIGDKNSYDEFVERWQKLHKATYRIVSNPPDFDNLSES